MDNNDDPVRVSGPNLSLDGTFTVKLRSGKHFTYRIETVKKGQLEGRRIAMLLTGSDNTSDYTAFGFVDSGCVINIWSRYRSSEAYSKHAALLEGRAQHHVYVWHQSSRCMKCGRMLTDPESVATGLGPKCGGRK